MNKRFSKEKVRDYLEASYENASSRFDLATEGLPAPIKLELAIKRGRPQELYDILSVQMDRGNITGAQMLEAVTMLDRMLNNEVMSETLKLDSYNYF
jgi:hypothetical protein